MNQQTTVIYHSADFDGLFCREIARKFLPPNTGFIGWDFADPPMDYLPEGRLYVMDLPVDRVFGFTFQDGKPVDGLTPESMLDVVELLHRTVWIDHHKSSIESHPKDIPGYRIDGVAACRLAWQWFTHDFGLHNPRCNPVDYDLPQKDHFIAREVVEPMAVRLAGEYDIWDKRDPRAEVFQFGLRSMDLTGFHWGQLLSIEKPSIADAEWLVQHGYNGLLEPDGTCVPAVVIQLLESGERLQRYQRQQDANAVNHRSFMVKWEGLRFLALNTVVGNSLTFAAKDVPETGHDALMMFRFDGKFWHFSLYHAKHRTDMDLSVIAVKHGGGGHRGACGFKLTKLPF